MFNRTQKKLVEESQEVCTAHDIDDLREELADLLQVITTICNFHEWTLQEIIEIMEKKAQTNRKFDDKIYIDYVEVNDDNLNIDYYRGKFREIE
ncbi:MazG nucleotide pyrophosphohydrolase domain-containing protein [Candidatus Gromoviella agglomerans]|uniref:MazG nucleotide pyrophosphohydrolase domain-containing protein n=1 Tax=Candidatus Gromoviella agglomerans TaxID=2806609 RepID=UPI00236831E7|nr:MazG nucleotide pyrophosphohydrolase domain-containing protein [Candidatus Gromoviella agglomerans]